MYLRVGWIRLEIQIVPFVAAPQVRILDRNKAGIWLSLFNTINDRNRIFEDQGHSWSRFALRPDMRIDFHNET